MRLKDLDIPPPAPQPPTRYKVVSDAHAMKMTVSADFRDVDVSIRLRGEPQVYLDVEFPNIFSNLPTGTKAVGRVTLSVEQAEAIASKISSAARWASLVEKKSSKSRPEERPTGFLDAGKRSASVIAGGTRF